jgi:FAD binding domain
VNFRRAVLVLFRNSRLMHPRSPARFTGTAKPYSPSAPRTALTECDPTFGADGATWHIQRHRQGRYLVLLSPIDIAAGCSVFDECHAPTRQGIRMNNRANRETLAVDVLVIGGGIAGTWAATAAARMGARVILAEKGWRGTSGVAAGPGHWWVPPDPQRRVQAYRATARRGPRSGRARLDGACWT